MKARVFLFSSLIAVIIALVFFCSGSTFAQTTAQSSTPPTVQTGTGTIRGQVTDPSASAVVGASIIATAPDGTSLAATTNRDGVFELKGVAPGKYTVEVIAKGFALYKNDAVQVAANQVQQLTIALTIEIEQQQVTVTGDSGAVDVSPTNNAGAIVINGAALDALPDDPDELQTDLTALAGPSAGPNGGQFYIDGFTAGQLPPKSAIREIRINQNPFSAQYDKVGYGRIEIFTTDIRDINDLSIVNAQIVDTTSPNFPIVPFSDAVPTPKRRYNLGPRLDYQLSGTNTLSVRYQYYRDNVQNDGITAFSLPTQAFNLLTTEHTLQVSDTQTLGPNVVNETRFQYLHQTSSQVPQNTATTLLVQGAFVGGGSNDGTIL